MDTTVDTAVLLVNLGSPESTAPADIGEFLREFLSDKRVVDITRWIWFPILYCIILPFRSRRIAKNYNKVWFRGASLQSTVPQYNAKKGISPLLYYLFSLGKQVQKRYSKEARVNVVTAVRYGARSVGKVLTELHDSCPTISKLIVIPLFPQYSSTTSACIFDKVLEFYQNPFRRRIPSLFLIREFYENTKYIEALGNSILNKLKEMYTGSWNSVLNKMEAELCIVFSFHSIPVRFAETGDDYPLQCRRTTALVQKYMEAEMGISLDRILLQVFQSRFGREPWLEPFLSDTLETLPLHPDTPAHREKKERLAHLSGKAELATRVVEKVLVVAPSFAAECLETLEEICVSGEEEFLGAGGKQLVYVPCLNDSESFVDTIASVADKYINL
ncbi:Ferrochelatase, putative [Angomonas deanei]|uniref:Ferrochelatase n=1 Tax=Angomonas deanei TaxID=59799 RepID=A0A7G2CP73_9TRYP|nr:Ferrochelatase, putative [Angomonas deanei]